MRASPSIPAPFSQDCLRCYGTILIDLEQHRPIELLEGREAETLAAWLREHPGVAIIVRDRAGAYAEGARRGAPGAVQIADRFHLLQNATQALIAVTQTHKRRIALAEATTEQADATTAISAEASPKPRLNKEQQEHQARRARRRARWEEVHRRHAAGQSQRQIARELDLNRLTVRQLLAQPEPVLTRKPPPPRPAGLSSPTLQPFLNYLKLKLIKRRGYGRAAFSLLRRRVLAA